MYIKIEKGNKIVVRVGGGFMDIDTFLNQFTESEVSKIMRKNDVLKRFENKLKLQFLSARLSMNKNETSPISKRKTARSLSQRGRV